MRRFGFRWRSRLRPGRTHPTAAGVPVGGAWPDATLTHPSLARVDRSVAAGALVAQNPDPSTPRIRLGFSDGSSVELDAGSSVHHQLRTAADRLGYPAVQDIDPGAD
jgi:hypothetical protein